MAGPEIRELTERDIGRAVELTDLESWGYGPGDVRRLLDLSDHGCFAAEADGRVIGILSTTPYGTAAFLGTVIVDPAWRGRGIGRALMDAALTHLERGGIETVRLNAYPHVVPFYERLGFRREYGNLRWEGGRVPGTPGDSVRPAREQDLPRLVDFDAPSFGIARSRLLHRLWEDFPKTFLVAERAGHLLGYLVGNPSAATCEIGPWVVDPAHEGTAGDLFASLLRATDREAFAFSAPEPNPGPHAFARVLAYREGFRSVRMVRGRDAHGGRLAAVWSFAGLEKG